MFGLFKTRAQRRPFSHEAGLHGTPADIAAAAASTRPWADKKPLMRGCLDACDTLEAQNLGAFIDGFMRRLLVNTPTSALSADASFGALVYTPLEHLLAKKQYQAAGLDPVRAHLGEPIYRLALDACLARAARNNDIDAAQGFIRCGARASAWKSLSLRSAAIRGHVDMARLLIDGQASIADATPPAGSQYAGIFDQTIAAACPPALSRTPYRTATVATAAVAGVGTIAAAIALISRKRAQPKAHISPLGVAQPARTQIKKPVIRRKPD